MFSICALMLGIAPALLACNTPVFRYALENWQAAPYELIILNKGALSPELSKSVDDLRNSSKDFCANLMLTTIDLADVPEDYKKIVDANKAEVLPWMILRYPANGPDVTIWSGPLKDKSSVLNLVDSPARKAITKHIVAGDGAVWLLVESGDKDADNKVIKLIESKLKNISDEMTEAFMAGLNAAAEGPGFPNESPKAQPAAPKKEQRIGCSLVRIAKGDKAEELFTRTLTAYQRAQTKEENKDVNQPTLSLIFGRGRKLLTMTGAEINEANIQGVAGFLTGPCMCEVKAQNPGIDLLLNVDWDADLDTLLHGELAPPVQTEASATATAQAQSPAPAPDAVQIQLPPLAKSDLPAPNPADAPSPSPVGATQVPAPSRMNSVLLFALGLVASGILVVIVSMREKRRLD
jgi:hypothetical protein